MWRQAAGKVPFHFRRAVKAIGKNEHTSEENDAATNDEPHEEVEEDLEGDGDSQVLQDLDNGQGAAQLAQLPTYAHRNKQADSRLPIYPTLSLLRYSLKANPIIILVLMARKLGKPMGHLLRIGGVPLALLGKSPHTTR